MTPLHVVLPMAGRGSRFEREGFAQPKPLIPLHGRPFYAWALDSLASKLPLGDVVCVVLREHVERFAIDRDIASRCPQARVVVLDEVTSGAAETAAIGLAALGADGPVAINDCDHAFDARGVDAMVDALADGRLQGALLGFRADSAAFSYARIGGDGRVTGTVEKDAVSPFAIAGCYLLADRAVFDAQYAAYRASCRYAELFMSGVYNHLIDAGGAVRLHELAQHIPFGTPAELARVDPQQLQAVVAPATP